jgi:glycosyltransferase 2 family protein
MGERLIRVGRWVVAILILAFVVRAFQRNWQDLQNQRIAWTFRPLPAVAGLLLIWTMYALLIEAWRRMLAGWGQYLAPMQAARIWVLSSLGKYVPGKVWAIAGMALMAKDAGVAPWAATASAIILQALAVGTGAAVAAVCGASALEAERPGMLVGLWLAGGAAVAGVLALVYPPVARRLLALARVGAEAPSPSPGPVLFGVLANVIAWLGYGAALWLLARAVLPTGELAIAPAIAGFAASYVAGLIALFVPGGLFIREGVLVVMLQGSIGLGNATALAVASRVLLTITELGIAVPFLIYRRGNPSAV